MASVFKKVLIACVFFFSTFLIFTHSAKSGVSAKWEDIDAKEVVFFVNAANKNALKQDGSKKFPFGTIDRAMRTISSLSKQNKKIKAKVYIKGTFSSNYSYIVSSPLWIIGTSSGKNNGESDVISFGKNAGWVVSSSLLQLERFTIKRKEVANEPRTVPIFYASLSHLGLEKVEVIGVEGGTMFSLSHASLSLQSSSILSNQSAYCNVIEANNAELSINSSNIECTSQKIIALDSQNSTINLENVRAGLNATYFAFFARCFNSNLTCQNALLSTKGADKLTDAIIYNEASQLKIENCLIEGFKAESAVKNDRVDYLKY